MVNCLENIAQNQQHSNQSDQNVERNDANKLSKDIQQKNQIPLKSTSLENQKRNNNFNFSVLTEGNTGQSKEERTVEESK